MVFVYQIEYDRARSEDRSHVTVTNTVTQVDGDWVFQLIPPSTLHGRQK
jgi:hypothetical protein